MVDMTENEDKRAAIKSKLRQNFDGKIVRKDLTKKIKEGANVPVYVLEFLLGQYCSADDPEIIEEGLENVKRIPAESCPHPDFTPLISFRKTMEKGVPHNRLQNHTGNRN